MEKTLGKPRNPVAKYGWRFNRKVVERDRKKDERKFQARAKGWPEGL